MGYYVTNRIREHADKRRAAARGQELILPEPAVRFDKVCRTRDRLRKDGYEDDAVWDTTIERLSDDLWELHLSPPPA